MIQQKGCPRCGFKRTVWIGGRELSVCFNCRFVWADSSPPGHARAPGTCSRPELPYEFTPAELYRLRLYRLAIQAGLYTDFPESERSRPEQAITHSVGKSSATWSGAS
jgi:hypothetical protein